MGLTTVFISHGKNETFIRFNQEIQYKDEVIELCCNEEMDGQFAFSRQNHPFFDQHNELLKAIWGIDRQAKSPAEKLAKLKAAIAANPPSTLVDILDEQTGQPKAKVSPLIIACFEGDYDTIKFLLDVRSSLLLSPFIGDHSIEWS